MRAVILAGGKGTRLHPYTVSFPKPLMPLGDMPVLEIVLRQLAAGGFHDVTLAVGHLAGLIEAFCGDGSKWGLAIEYVYEDEPLGTAGALAVMPPSDAPFLVMNGDVLTTIDYGRLVAEHASSGAVATAVATRREFPVEFGVVRTDDAGDLLEWVEKPVHTHDVSIGVYVLSPSALDHIGAGESLGMPDLLERMRRAGSRVRVERTDEYWLDIGRVDDYARAQMDFEAMRDRFLGGA